MDIDNKNCSLRLETQTVVYGELKDQGIYEYGPCIRKHTYFKDTSMYGSRERWFSKKRNKKIKFEEARGNKVCAALESSRIIFP